ncbi:hypothetical protein [Rhabdothermincola sediminis]|nr:hypothetical protein [Rhabdothermincola sediminis]
MSERTDVVTALRHQQAELESLVDHLSEARPPALMALTCFA